MWGAPEFDSYTFLIHFAADVHSNDGMEHLTSTQIIESGALADPGVYEDALDAIAHEFFHVWNVKRLRPVELGPWDFTRAASTRGLWIAEVPIGVRIARSVDPGAELVAVFLRPGRRFRLREGDQTQLTRFAQRHRHGTFTDGRCRVWLGRARAQG